MPARNYAVIQMEIRDFLLRRGTMGATVKEMIHTMPYTFYQVTRALKTMARPFPSEIRAKSQTVFYASEELMKRTTRWKSLQEAQDG